MIPNIMVLVIGSKEEFYEYALIAREQDKLISPEL